MTTLSLISLFYIFIGLAVLAQGILVLFHSTSTSGNRSFFLFTLAIFLWLVGTGFSLSAPDGATASFWYNKVGFLGVAFIPSVFYIFASSLIKQISENKTLIIITGLLSAFFFLMANVSDALITGYHAYPWGWYPQYGWLGILFIIYLFGLFVKGLSDLLVSMEKIPGHTKKKQIRLFTASVIIGLLAVSDFVPCFGVDIVPIGYVFILTFIGILTYTMTRYGFVFFGQHLALPQVFHNMPVGIIGTSTDFQILFVNDMFESLVRKREEELLNRYISDLFYNDKSTGSQLTNLQTQDRTHKLRTADGGTLPVKCQLSSIRNPQNRDEVLGYVCVIEDISKELEANEQLRKSKKELQHLAARLESVREEERTRISREVHDTLGQILTGIRIDVEWIRDRLEEGQKTLRETADTLLELVEEATDTTRRISEELRPGVLDKFGLSAAIEWQAEEFKSKTGISCRIEGELEEGIMDAERRTAMFRIYQEALTNITRHANASQVTISQFKRDGILWLLVQDNGVGIDPKEIEQTESLGILGMKERANQCNGTVKIDGRPGQGTTVYIQFPIDESVQEGDEVSSKTA
ncbi:MAG: PAS domain-containing protein [Candidatus Marinimicrobia bacterium]|nr:PAS domain-containing protein [Candidatus Neomarinimicrobiota bacterium]